MPGRKESELIQEPAIILINLMRQYFPQLTEEKQMELAEQIDAMLKTASCGQPYSLERLEEVVSTLASTADTIRKRTGNDS